MTAALQAHYDRNADATGHSSDCRRRVIPTLTSDSRAIDPDRCGRCRDLVEMYPRLRALARR